MSRKFIDGHGVDSSAAATAYLKTHRELRLPDLYVLNTAPQFAGAGGFCGPAAAGTQGPFTGLYSGGQNQYSTLKLQPCFEPVSGSFCWIESFSTDYIYGANHIYEIMVVFADGCGNLTRKNYLMTGQFGDGPSGILVPDGAGSFYAGNASGYANSYRWSHLNAGCVAPDVFVGNTGSVGAGCFTSAEPGIPVDACVMGGLLYVVGIADGPGGPFFIRVIGGASEICDNSVPVPSGSGISCMAPAGSCATCGGSGCGCAMECNPHGGCDIFGTACYTACCRPCECINVTPGDCMPQISLGVSDVVPQGGSAYACSICTSGSEIFTLIQNATQTILYRGATPYIVGPGGPGTGTFTYLAAIEYCPADESLIYWMDENTVHKWSLATNADIATASIPFRGTGPVSGGLMAVGLELMDPTTLIIVDTSYVTVGAGLRLTSTSVAGNFAFKHWYDAVNQRIWVQQNHDGLAGADEIWAIQQARAAGTAGGLGSQFLLTDFPSPLTWDYRGTFEPADIKRAEIKSKIGWDADTLDIEWSPKDTNLIGGGRITALAAFGYGVFDNAQVEVWRCSMPREGDLVGSPPAAAKLGDCNTYGAALMFAGRIGDIKPTRSGAVFTVISRMENLNIQVPTTLIEPTNIYAANSVGVVPSGGVPSFTVVGGGSTQKIVYGAPAVAAGLYNGGYIVFMTGAMRGFYARIIEQLVTGSYTEFYLAQGLPWIPDAGDTFTGFVGLPLDASGTPYGGFRWTPAADNSAVIL